MWPNVGIGLDENFVLARIVEGWRRKGRVDEARRRIRIESLDEAVSIHRRRWDGYGD
jgi:hypothetical protein